MLAGKLNKEVKLTDEGSTITWKHIINKGKLRSTIDKNQETLFIVVYKPAINWIKSMIKRQYMVKWDKNIYSECEFRKITFRNIIHLYNSYYRMYRKFCQRFPNVIFVSYYDIIKKDTVLEYINGKLVNFDLKVVDEEKFFGALERPSKRQSGKPVSNWKEAQLKKDENPFSNEELEFINNEENKNVKMYFN